VSDEAAFLDAIRANPESDAPRLVYADWLDEHGQSERAEFIRAQIASDRLPAGDPNKQELWRQATAIRQIHEAEWLKPLREALAGPPPSRRPDPRLSERWEHVSFRRGFVNLLMLAEPPFEVVTKAAEFFRSHPVEDLNASWLSRRFDAALLTELAGSPYMTALRKLGIQGRGRVGIAFVRRLCHSPYLRRLREFSLDVDMTGGAVREIIESPLAPQLTCLDLSSSNALGMGAYALLADSPRLDGLTFLGLQAGDLDDAALRRLAEGTPRDHLTRLRIRTQAAGPDGLRAILESPQRPPLTALALDGSRCFGTDGVAVLAASPRISRLTILGLRSMDLTNRAIATLSRSPHLAGMRELDLSSNRLTAAAVVALAQQPSLGGLTFLNLSSNPIGDRGVMALAGAPQFAGLRMLWLSGCNVGDRGARALAESPYLGNLNHLSLHSNSIGPSGLAALRDRFGTVVKSGD
jgi:uncharacterized protein (TIGR02996 family)